MMSNQPMPRLFLAPDDFGAHYNRTPFGFHHNLHGLELFSDASLAFFVPDLRADHPEDYFVAQSTQRPGAAFYSVPRASLQPRRLIIGARIV